MTPLALGTRLGTALQTILAGDALEVVQKWVKVAQKLHNAWMRNRLQGIYEVESHATTLELTDPQGEVAVVDRVETVRFLQDNVTAFTDFAWGDGDSLAEYRCSPGVPVDIYQDGSRQAILISLRETKSRGDVLTFRIHREIAGGFSTSNECWETDIYHRMRALSVKILFPCGRRCQRATVTQRSTSKTVVLGPKHFLFLEDGRQQLTWTLANPRLNERYSLKWNW